jgi:hypothetical protein
MMIILPNRSDKAFFRPSATLEENSIAIFQSRWREDCCHPTSIGGGFNQRDEDETGFEIGCTRRGVNVVAFCCNDDTGFGW